MVTREMAPPRISEGLASGRYTFQTIWKVEAPMDWAASTTPASTSLREVSTIRAMKGAAETTRGTMAPRTPMVVPTTIRVKGMMATIRIMKGMDRPMLTIQSSTR